MRIPHIAFGAFLLSCTLFVAGCGSSNEATQIPVDPNAVEGTDAEGSFPDATSDEMKEMEEAAAAGESP